MSVQRYNAALDEKVCDAMVATDRLFKRFGLSPFIASYIVDHDTDLSFDDPELEDALLKAHDNFDRLYKSYLSLSNPTAIDRDTTRRLKNFLEGIYQLLLLPEQRDSPRDNLVNLSGGITSLVPGLTLRRYIQERVMTASGLFSYAANVQIQTRLDLEKDRMKQGRGPVELPLPLEEFWKGQPTQPWRAPFAEVHAFYEELVGGYLDAMDPSTRAHSARNSAADYLRFMLDESNLLTAANVRDIEAKANEAAKRCIEYVREKHGIWHPDFTFPVNIKLIDNAVLTEPAHVYGSGTDCGMNIHLLKPGSMDVPLLSLFQVYYFVTHEIGHGFGMLCRYLNYIAGKIPKSFCLTTLRTTEVVPLEVEGLGIGTCLLRSVDFGHGPFFGAYCRAFADAVLSNTVTTGVIVKTLFDEGEEKAMEKMKILNPNPTRQLMNTEEIRSVGQGDPALGMYKLIYGPCATILFAWQRHLGRVAQMLRGKVEKDRRALKRKMKKFLRHKHQLGNSRIAFRWWGRMLLKRHMNQKRLIAKDVNLLKYNEDYLLEECLFKMIKTSLNTSDALLRYMNTCTQWAFSYAGKRNRRMPFFRHGLTLSPLDSSDLLQSIRPPGAQRQVSAASEAPLP